MQGSVWLEGTPSRSPSSLRIPAWRAKSLRRARIRTLALRQAPLPRRPFSRYVAPAHLSTEVVPRRDQGVAPNDNESTDAASETAGLRAGWYHRSKPSTRARAR